MYTYKWSPHNASTCNWIFVSGNTLPTVFFTEMCAQNEFYCVTREECLPLEVRCDGVLDCFFGDDIATDESNCDGQ